MEFTVGETMQDDLQAVMMNSRGFADIELAQHSDHDYSFIDSNFLATYPYFYALIKVLWGPYHVISDYREIIFVALLAKLITSLIRILPLASKRVLNQLALIVLGTYQMDRYLNKSCPDWPTSRGIVYSIALCYVSYGAMAHKLQALVVKANLPNSRFMCSAPLYFIAFAPIILNEYRIQLNLLRSLLMTLTMKLFSMILVNTRPRNPLSLMAYLLHPASSVLGVWHPYTDEDDEEVREEKFLTLKCCSPIIKLLREALKLLMILIISTNISELIEYVELMALPELVKTSAKIYFTSLEFRFSHYFSGYLSGALLGIFMCPSGEPYHICGIQRVEWPRSLVDVVTAWNKPMHFWLKQFIFKRMLRSYSVALAIFVTYVVSSLLHGCKFHIWAVLLTLGSLTWVEHRLRKNLAQKLNACVLAQECQYKLNLRSGKPKCIRGHSLNPKNSYLAKSINLLFTLHAIAQLAYLGYIFVGDTDQASYMEVIERWSSVYFFGHVLGTATYLISVAI